MRFSTAGWLMGWLVSSQSLGQVLFAPTLSNKAGGGWASPAPKEIRVTYFDSVAVGAASHRQHQSALSSEKNAMVDRSIDSLWIMLANAGSNYSTLRSDSSLQEVPAISPIRLQQWQDFKVSSRFGWRRHPLSGKEQLHTGLDIPQPTGTPVYTTADGRVIWAGWQMGGLGLGVCIEHLGGYKTIYGHLSVHTVKAGQVVRRGSLIGRVGSTGRSTGPHLHYAILYTGTPVDPARYCFLWMKQARTKSKKMAGPDRRRDARTNETVTR